MNRMNRFTNNFPFSVLVFCSHDVGPDSVALAVALSIALDRRIRLLLNQRQRYRRG